MVEPRTTGQRLIEGATEALAVARGGQPAAAIWIDGHQYVPAAEIQHLRAEVERLRKIISDCADATGAFVAPTCSLEFMEGLPNEIRLSRAGLRAEAFERAAQIAEKLPVLRQISTAHVKATTPKDVATAIRQAGQEVKS